MEEVEHLRARIRAIRKNESELKRLISKGQKEIREAEDRINEIDKNKVEFRNRLDARRKMESDAIRQNSVVMALRNIGKPSTAGPICKELGRLGIKKLHNSMFATTYLESIRQDPRIIITGINASKNRYALREWDQEKRGQ